MRDVRVVGVMVVRMVGDSEVEAEVEVEGVVLLVRALLVLVLVLVLELELELVLVLVRYDALFGDAEERKEGRVRRTDGKRREDMKMMTIMQMGWDGQGWDELENG